MSAEHFQAQVMPGDQASLLKELGARAHASGYYFAGGTAVALRVGHRRSIDFEWFSQRPTVEPEHIPARLQESGHPFSVRSQSFSLIDGHIRRDSGDVRALCLSHARSPGILGRLRLWHRLAVDLSCMKLAAIAQRGSRKDFIDIHALLQHGISLVALLGHYRRKYGVSDVMPVLRGLTYFDDAEREPMPEMLLPLDWTGLKATLYSLTREAFQELHRTAKS